MWATLQISVLLHTKMLLNKKLCINEEKRLNVKSYYATEWKLISDISSALYTPALFGHELYSTRQDYALKKRLTTI